MEKKQIKVSLGTVIAIIVAVILAIIIFFMGMYIVNQNKQIDEIKALVTNNFKEETTNAKVNVKNNNSIAGNEQKTQNTSNEKTTETAVNEQKTQNISNEKITEMARKTIEKYEELEPYQFSATELGAMPYILYELGLEKDGNIDKLLANYNVDIHTYIKSNTKYADFKNEMLKYVTEELFNKEYYHYVNIDGYVGIQNIGTGIPTNIIKSLELISNNGNEYTFKVIMIDGLAYDNYLIGDSTLTQEDNLQATAVCKYINGNLVVSEMNYNN